MIILRFRHFCKTSVYIFSEDGVIIRNCTWNVLPIGCSHNVKFGGEYNEKERSYKEICLCKTDLCNQSNTFNLSNNLIFTISLYVYLLTTAS